jgi:hypothetical protein
MPRWIILAFRGLARQAAVGYTVPLADV